LDLAHADGHLGSARWIDWASIAPGPGNTALVGWVEPQTSARDPWAIVQMLDVARWIAW
jgi:hypothetical protein